MSAAAAAEEAAAPLRTGATSPPPYPAKSKAQRGAEAAAQAAQFAAMLRERTRAEIEAQRMQDLKLPCAAVSPTGFAAERVRTIPANVAQGSRWCDSGRVWRPTERVCPTTSSDATMQDLLAAGLTSLSLREQQVTMEHARVLAELLGPGSRITALDLSKCLADDPPVPPQLLEEAKAVVAAELPEPRDDEDAEALERAQQAVEKLKGEFSTYEAAIEFLARKRLDRTAAVLEAVASNETVTDLNLSSNRWGAPRGDDGRAFFQPLRRLAKLLDVNTSVAVLDLSDNNFGPVGCGIVAKAMTKNIGVRTLDLSGNDLVGEPADEEEDPEQEEDDPVFGELQQGLEALSEVIKKNKFLRAVSLANNRIKPEIEEDAEDDGSETQLGKFLQPLTKYHRLQVLDLSANELGAAGMRLLADSLVENRSIRTLDVSDNKIGPRGFQHLARLLERSNTLETLHAKQNDGGGKKGKRSRREALQAMQAFSAGIAACGTLQVLDLSANYFGVELSAVLMDGVVAAPSLYHLTFASNALCGVHSTEYSTDALEKLITALSKPGSTIRILNVASNNILSAGCAAMAENPDTLRSVQSLDLSRNEIGDAGCAAVSQHLRDAAASTTIAELNIAFNGIVDCSAVAQMLRTTASLTSLNLSHNSLGTGDPAATQALLDAVSGRPLVTALDLSSNKLVSVHARQVSSFCKHATPPFSKLDLYDNPGFTIEDATRIVSSLRNNMSITSLRLSSQQSDPTPLIDAITATLDVNSCITDLDLCLPADVDDAIVTSIRRKLLRNSLGRSFTSVAAL